MIIRLQGAAGNVIVLQPTKTAMTFCDIDPGRWIDVPASIFMSSFHDGTWLTREPPSRYSNNLFYIWNYRWSFTIDSVASEPSSVFSPKTMSPTVFLIFWIISPSMSPMYLDYFVKTTSPMYFLMTLLDMEIIQENFYYS